MTNEQIREKYATDSEYRERLKASSRRYYDKHKNDPEFKQRNYERVRKWRSENPDKLKAYRKSDKFREYQRQRYRKNGKRPTPEKAQEYAARYLAKLRECRKIVSDPEYAAMQPPEVVEYAKARVAKERARSKRYYEAHREDTLARNKEYRLSHLEDYRRKRREYYQRKVREVVYGKRRAEKDTHTA